MEAHFLVHHVSRKPRSKLMSKMGTAQKFSRNIAQTFTNSWSVFLDLKPPPGNQREQKKLKQCNPISLFLLLPPFFRRDQQSNPEFSKKLFRRLRMLEKNIFFAEMPLCLLYLQNVFFLGANESSLVWENKTAKSRNRTPKKCLAKEPYNVVIYALFRSTVDIPV